MNWIWYENCEENRHILKQDHEYYTYVSSPDDGTSIRFQKYLGNGKFEEECWDTNNDFEYISDNYVLFFAFPDPLSQPERSKREDICIHIGDINSCWKCNKSNLSDRVITTNNTNDAVL